MKNETFDAVQFMRQVRERMSSEMQGLSFEEQKKYIAQHAEKLCRELEAQHQPVAV